MCKNKVFLGGSIVESYLVEEIFIFNSFYFDNDKLTRIVRQPQFHEGGPRGRASCLPMFSCPGRSIGPEDNDFPLSEDKFHVAHTYVLVNCLEVSTNV